MDDTSSREAGGITSPPTQSPVASTSRQTRSVLVLLDPILQQLLELTTEFKRLAEASGYTNSSDNNNNNNNQRFIEIVALQIKFLQELQNAIRDLGHDFAPSLVVLADYISLPLTAILHVQVHEPKVENNNNLSTNNDEANMDQTKTETIKGFDHAQVIRRDALYKLYGASVSTLQTYVQITSIDRKNEASSGTPLNSIMATSLSDRHITNYLVALAKALPDYQQQQQPKKQQQLKSLNDGSDFWIMLLDTIQTMLVALSNRPHLLLWDIWNGALLAQIVDGISLLISPSPYGIVSNDTVHLQAISTLDRLVIEVHKASFWRSIFPTAFGAIYRQVIQLHRQTSSGHSTSIECAGIRLLTRIFRHTMTMTPEEQQQQQQQLGNSGPSAGVVSTSVMLANLQLLTAQQSERSASPSEPADTSTAQQQSQPGDNASISFSFFQTKVHQGVIAPLLVLLRQSAVSTSAQVRLTVLEFCKVLLIDTHDFWEQDSEDAASSSSPSTSSNSSISELSMDICLTLESDRDDDVANEASKVLTVYQSTVLDSKRGRDSGRHFVSKVLEKIERLPTLAQGSKTIEMRNELHLLAGYLRALGSSSAAALSASVTMRRSLVATLDIDFQPTKKGAITSTNMETATSTELQYRFLNLETRHSAQLLLIALGKALDYKHGAIVVDALLVDMFESGGITQESVLLTGNAFLEWMHQWIGSLVVAKWILKGSFGDNGDDEKKNPKRRKRRHRVLKSLASSVLPLLCDSVLWNLPTQNLDKFQASANTQPRPASKCSLSLQANTCMVVLTIELVSSFCVLLEKDCEEFHSFLITSLADRAHQLNSPLVQKAAHRCMHQLAGVFYGPGSDVSRLVSGDMSPLLASMMGRLRLPGGIRALKKDEFDENLLRVGVLLRWILETQKSNLDQIETHSHQSAVVAMMDLMRSIIAGVDHYNLNKRLSDVGIMEFNWLYRSSLEYLLVYWGASSEEVYRYQMQNAEEHEPTQPWLDLLTCYRKPSFESGFNPTINDQDGSCHDHLSSPKKNLADETEGWRVLTKSEINFVSLVINRSCLFLSHKDLHVKIATCNSLTSGFKFLAFVSCQYIDPADEQSTIQNSILRQVASSWPSIKARLVTVSEELNKPDGLTSLLSINKYANETLQDDGTKDAIRRLFLAKLFTLVATLCECSGDFMADRFKTDVWKLAIRHLGSDLQRQQRNSTNPRVKELQDHGGSWATSERHAPESEILLVASILDCIQRVFRQRDCSAALTGIMESAGTVLLPYLEHEDKKIRLSASQALKSIVSEDYDVLRRPLLSMSGRGIPPLPKLKNLRHGSLSGVHGRSYTKLGSNTYSKVEEECGHLLQFIEGLPEQRVS